LEELEEISDKFIDLGTIERGLLVEDVSDMFGE
jgi:hypothetical protein